MQAHQPPLAPPAAPPQRMGPPIRTPFFYGWIIVICMSIAGFLASGVSNVVMGIMLKPISDETGWTRTMITGVLTAGAIGAGLASPFLGRWTDRYGSRVVMVPAGIVSGTLYLMIAWATVFPLFAVAHAANRIVTQAATQLAAQAAVAQWFMRRRPRAMGIVAMSSSLGAAIMALVGQAMLDTSGWRGLMVLYGVLTLAVFLPATYLLRRRPEDVGLTIDGVPAGSAVPTASRHTSRTKDGREYSWTLSEALHTRTWWLITAATCVASFAVTSVGIHLVAYLTDQGISPAAAAGALSVYAFSSASANLVWGFVSEHFDERLMLVVVLLLSIPCLWLLTIVSSVWMAYVFVILFGLFARGEGTLIQILKAQYFGPANFGAINGAARPFQTAASSFGPLASAVVFDMTGNYLGAFYADMGIFAVAALLMALARRPQLPGHTQAA